MRLSELTAALTGARWMITPTGDDREHPSRDEIARLAYHIYETRQRCDGRDVDDWLAAERQLVHHYR